MEPRSITISPFLLLHQLKVDKYLFIVYMNTQYPRPNSLMLAISSSGALIGEEKNVLACLSGTGCECECDREREYDRELNADINFPQSVLTNLIFVQKAFDGRCFFYHRHQSFTPWTLTALVTFTSD